MNKLFFLILNLLCITNVWAQNTEKIRSKAEEALDYCTQNSMNIKICFLVDMSIHSGKPRLFIWDFEKDSIVGQGLCSHGCCENSWASDDTKTNPTFSNVPESHCSSLGKYRIGERGWSSFGVHFNYKLYGLESTNNNAYNRVIVFHSWNVMSNTETYPEGSPESWGCPAVSNEFMHVADKHLKAAGKDVLMWIYKETK